MKRGEVGGGGEVGGRERREGEGWREGKKQVVSVENGVTKVKQGEGKENKVYLMHTKISVLATW